MYYSLFFCIYMYRQRATCSRQGTSALQIYFPFSCIHMYMYIVTYIIDVDIEHQQRATCSLQGLQSYFTFSCIHTYMYIVTYIIDRC